jgi:hypothetical protein
MKNTNDEIVAHDSPATFKVRVNVVLVRVVVRDSDGKVVTNLKKADFQLADDRKDSCFPRHCAEDRPGRDYR